MGTGAVSSGAERWHLCGLPPAAWIAKHADAGWDESTVGSVACWGRRGSWGWPVHC